MDENSQRSVNKIVNENRTLQYIQKIGYTKFIKSDQIVEFYFHNGRIYRKSSSNEMKLTCMFVFGNNKFCTNYDVYSGYCRFHKNGTIQDIKSTVEIGDDTEKYVENVLKSFNGITNVIRIGNEGSKCDIIYQVIDEIKAGNTIFRGIQVKTIGSKGTSGNYYYFPNDKIYDQHTLMVGVNSKRTFACIFFYFQIFNRGSSFPLDFLSDNDLSFGLFTNNNVNKITGMTFLQQLEYFLKYSMIYDGKLNDNSQKEKIAYYYLQNECIKRNIQFNFNDTSDSEIDVFLNGKKIQCKTSCIDDSEGLSIYNISTKINSQRCPYTEAVNVDFFIFIPLNVEIFQIYVIPKDVLLYLGFFTSQNTKGKKTIIIPKDKFKDNHHFSQFRDRYDLLLYSGLRYFHFQLFNDIISRFENECSKRSIPFKRNNSNICSKNAFVGKYFVSFVTTKKEYSTKRGNNATFRIMPPHSSLTVKFFDFYIFENTSFPGNFIIIPILEFYYHNQIDSNANIIKESITLPLINEIPIDHWVYKYINNFNILNSIN